MLQLSLVSPLSFCQQAFSSSSIGASWPSSPISRNWRPWLRILTCNAARLAQKSFRACSSFKDLKDERSEEHTSELQSRPHLVCRLLLEKKKKKIKKNKKKSHIMYINN